MHFEEDLLVRLFAAVEDARPPVAERTAKLQPTIAALYDALTDFLALDCFKRGRGAEEVALSQAQLLFTAKACAYTTLWLQLRDESSAVREVAASSSGDSASLQTSDLLPAPTQPITPPSLDDCILRKCPPSRALAGLVPVRLIWQSVIPQSFLLCRCTERGRPSDFVVLKKATSIIPVCTPDGLEWAVGEQQRCKTCRGDAPAKSTRCACPFPAHLIAPCREGQDDRDERDYSRFVIYRY